MEISDWERYAAEEYELLVAEEGAGDQQEDMYVILSSIFPSILGFLIFTHFMWLK